MNPNSVRASSPTAATRTVAPISFPAIGSQQARFLKRATDLVLASVASLVLFPVAVLVALAIRLESPGPVLYRHKRIGRGNKPFQLWKFRTMVMSGDDVLQQYFASDGTARVEWEATQKLRHDPRVTRVGRFLRRTSLDELPQLWNVLRGEMSLAGPRPIVDGEIRNYGSAFGFYCLAYPGMTGLWQVSGRNDTSYRRRVELDVHYVRHWSVWLDLRLFLRTFWIVLTGKGAY